MYASYYAVLYRSLTNDDITIIVDQCTCTVSLYYYAESPAWDVCVGDHITLICNSSTGRLRWTFMFPESVEPAFFTRSIASTRMAETEEIFIVNETATIFHIQRRSDFNTTPLVSSIFIENVSAGINGTNISCSVPNSDSKDKQFMILVIDDNHKHGKLDHCQNSPGT